MGRFGAIAADARAIGAAVEVAAAAYGRGDLLPGSLGLCVEDTAPDTSRRGKPCIRN
jgi:hypothetical protein